MQYTDMHSAKSTHTHKVEKMRKRKERKEKRCLQERIPAVTGAAHGDPRKVCTNQGHECHSCHPHTLQCQECHLSVTAGNWKRVRTNSSSTPERLPDPSEGRQFFPQRPTQMRPNSCRLQSHISMRGQRLLRSMRTVLLQRAVRVD